MQGDLRTRFLFMMRRSDFIRERLPVVPCPDLDGLQLHLARPNSGLSALHHVNGAPYWAYLWAGGRGLARYVLDHPKIVAGKSVVDFGAGSGVAGIAALRAGATSVVSVDTDPNARVACILNARANGVQTIPRKSLTKVPEILLAGDVFYNPKVARRVLPILRRAQKAGAEVIIGDPIRRDLPLGILDPVAEIRTADFGSANLVPTGIFRLKA